MEHVDSHSNTVTPQSKLSNIMFNFEMGKISLTESCKGDMATALTQCFFSKMGFIYVASNDPRVEACLLVLLCTEQVLAVEPHIKKNSLHVSTVVPTAK